MYSHNPQSRLGGPPVPHYAPTTLTPSYTPSSIRNAPPSGSLNTLGYPSAWHSNRNGAAPQSTPLPRPPAVYTSPSYHPHPSSTRSSENPFEDFQSVPQRPSFSNHDSYEKPHGSKTNSSNKSRSSIGSTKATLVEDTIHIPGRRICHVPISVFSGIIVVPFSCLVTFVFSALFTWVGGKVWTMVSPTDPSGLPRPPKAPITAPLAHAMLAGVGVVNPTLCVTTLALNWVIHFVSTRRWSVVMWYTIVIGTGLASLFTCPIGMAVLPPHGNIDGVTIKDVFEASSLGAAVVMLPVIIVVILACWARGC